MAMRILWVKVGGLWPVNTGGRQRSFQILSELARRHRVVLLTTHAPGEDPRPLSSALAACESVHAVPYSIPKVGSARFAASLARSWFSPYPVDLWKCRVPALREKAEEVLANGKVDVCVADFLAAAPNLPGGHGTPVVLFEHNVEHQIWKRLCDSEGQVFRRALLALEWRKMRSCEARACARSRRTVAVSESDRAALAAAAPSAHVRAVPTGVDTSYFAPQAVRQRPLSLVFSGAMDWYPNEDGILRFIETTLPLIRREEPGVSLTVVGRNPTAQLQAAAAAAGVRVTGTVEDVRPSIAEAEVYVVPLRIGGGTRLKIFEALAMGKPVVSSSVGAEGLPLASGRHLILADEPAAFAGAVLSLLRHPEERRALGEAGRRLVVENYSWAQVARSFEAQLAKAVGHAN
jgi:glycosyltransferase involved in cell wall biosynthesis